MAVTRTCAVSKMGVQLNVTNGEYLQYEVTFLGAQAVFAITDQHGEVILSPATPPVVAGKYATRWPRPDSNVKIPDDLNHTLGMHFITATEYGYTIRHCASDGNVIAVRKRCDYERSEQTDSFFEPFRILTV